MGHPAGPLSPILPPTTWRGPKLAPDADQHQVESRRQVQRLHLGVETPVDPEEVIVVMEIASAIVHGRLVSRHVQLPLLRIRRRLLSPLRACRTATICRGFGPLLPGHVSPLPIGRPADEGRLVGLRIEGPQHDVRLPKVT